MRRKVREEARLLAERLHADPHRVLGIHDDGGGWVARAWRPGAAAVRWVPEHGAAVPMDRVDDLGLFAVTLPDRPGRYLVETTWSGGGLELERDAYAFLPTLGELDLYLVGEGSHRQLWERLGARRLTVDGVAGTAFAVWAPNARGVSVVGDFNHWDGRRHPMRSLGASGVWEIFLPGVGAGAAYKFEIRAQDGSLHQKADPMAQWAEVRPRTASRVFSSRHRWADREWMAARPARRPHREPVAIYEVHLPSWRRRPEEGHRPLTYRELADELGDYVVDMGFTHVELMPVTEHPFDGSWGYQTTGYYAATSRMGEPDDLRALVDALHRRGVGVILDWAPAHFPRDDWALARFDGTPLYEHADPLRGEHPDWGTLVFNHGRTEVRNFLVASGLFWLREFHVDGLRVDAVASMLYRDYSRKEGEWVPGPHGEREDRDAIGFLQQLNVIAHAEEPGALVAAEESTAWPGVTRMVKDGGLGFDLKWNMGWMHDTLRYFARDPVHRSHHHDDITFGLLYAFSEQFVLPLSHDEVVHGKGSLLGRMPGDRWQRFANLRALYGHMWAHPGKKLLFMGAELAQEGEWSHEHSLDWHLLADGMHAGVQALVRDLNRAYRAEPALHEVDFRPEGFAWLVADDAANNVVAYARFPEGEGRPVVCVANLSPVPREGYRLGLPAGGRWRELVNTDATVYGGSGMGNAGVVVADGGPLHGQPASAALVVPPLAAVWLAPEA
ncbi:MAG: 1,4-alpha-glucan branching protein GlgB [Actinomycetota bacterium]